MDAAPTPSPAPLGAILAGGAGSRFGGQKALATVGGRRIVERVRDALAAVVPEVVLIVNEPDLFAHLHLPTRGDEVRGMGPLAGIAAALRRARETGRGGALCVAADMPLVNARVLRMIADRGSAGDAESVAPESGGRRGVEPLCAWYSLACLPVIERMLAAGEGAAHLLLERVRTERIPLAQVRRAGDPAVLFFNVNTVDDLREAERMAATPPVVCIVGKKNSGKTTLTVALLAELRRRGLRVASIKHGHHAFETDQPGRDSWRHFNEGEAEATLMAGTGKIALVMRTDGEPDPAALVRDFYAGRGYDLVLIEGYKHGPMPKVEIFRRAVHDRPVHDPADADAASRFLAIVTDDPELRAACPVIPLDPADPRGRHVARVADVILQHTGRDA
ncbi:MAG TPA: molybdopterin-guanine dinucleotide biosynthesis protein B [Longimicrobium sp.]|nr:molybdopterin-guanine dinucleotide biosynthesis protein B [Longimicrobium sp.]